MVRLIFGVAIASAASFAITLSPSFGGDDSRYPDWRGMWVRIGGAGFEPNKPNGRGQEPPLTPEYQAIWEANMADQESGGQDYNPQVRCLPGGLPRMMIVYEPGMEVIIQPEKTVIYISFNSYFRQIHTDGRGWPQKINPTFSGYSIGRWVDQNGDGQLNLLEVETRGLKGPRVFEASGIPFHLDNETVVRERIGLDPANSNVLRDEITVFDHALIHPWKVTRTYRRDRDAPWVEHFCTENNQYLFIGHETFFMSADGYLMPTKKNQPPPDLRNFKQTVN
jgi:hypothetical protein